MGGRRLIVLVEIAEGSAIGLFLAVPFYSFLQSRSTPTLIALGLAGMAFFFGFILLSLVMRVALGVAEWRKLQRGRPPK